MIIVIDIKESPISTIGKGNIVGNSPAVNQNSSSTVNDIAPKCQKKHISSLQAPESLAADLLSQVMKKYGFLLFSIIFIEF